MATFRRPLESARNVPHDINSSLPKESDRVPQNGGERHRVGQNVDASGMLDGQRWRAAGNGDSVSESVDIGASTCTSLVPLRRARVPDPERPMDLNNSGMVLDVNVTLGILVDRY